MKAFATLLFLFITSLSFSQKMTILERPKVDERIELLSIVFRLAAIMNIIPKNSDFILTGFVSTMNLLKIMS